MRIIGIDPGMAETGFGIINCLAKRIVLVNHGSIKTAVDLPSPTRLGQIYQQTMCLLREHNPEILAIESLFFNVNVKSASAVGQAIGVIKLAAMQNNIEVFEYPPLKIKMVLSGNGRAEKSMIQDKVKDVLHMVEIPKPNHASDALAVAICHWQELKKINLEGGEKVKLKNGRH